MTNCNNISPPYIANRRQKPTYCMPVKAVYSTSKSMKNCQQFGKNAYFYSGCASEYLNALNLAIYVAIVSEHERKSRP